VQNFQGFRNLELKDIKRVNLIGGKNNVGKTSLLEALMIYTGKYRTVYYGLNTVALTEDIQREYMTGLPRVYSRNGDLHRWDSLFFNFDIENEINFVGDGFPSNMLPSFDNLRISLETVSSFDMNSLANYRFIRALEDTDFAKLEQIIKFERPTHNTIYLIKDGKYLLTSDILNQPIPSQAVRSQSTVESRDTKAHFSKLKQEKSMKILIDALQIIEPRLINVDLLSDGIYVDIEGMSQLIPLTSMGEGMSRIASIVLTMANVRDGLVVIDEVENGLHFSVQEKLWKVIANIAHQFNVQVFATTHSLEMIRAAQQAFAETPDDDFRYYRLDRDAETNDPVAVKYSQKTMAAAVEMGYEVRG
ncbi:MAG: AAA family ATPase, partial [Chloroflexota bacterium]